MPYVEANGINMYYEEQGEGYPLVMIMGLAGNMDWWEPDFISLLAEKFHVVTFDNRGVGRTDKFKGVYTIELMAEDTAEFIKAIGIERAHILGASMGGKIAQQLILEHPGLVERLVLCCTNSGGVHQVAPRPEIYAMLGTRRKGITAEDVARASLNILYTESYVRDNAEKMEAFLQRYKTILTPGHAFFGQLEATASYDSFVRLSEIEAPTLILTGGSDELIPPENSRILLDHIPDARLIVYEEAAHFFFSQYVERVAADILSFLQN